MQPPPFHPGALIQNRFRVVSVLGGGGQATVYTATDSRCNDRTVALKVVYLSSSQSDALRRATAEYAVLSKLSHPNIVRVYDAGRLPDDGCYIAMEHIAGTTLAARITAVGRIPFTEALQTLREMAIGLEAAHAADVIHRDLKPANVLLTSDGGVKLIDFGLARDMELGETLTDTGFTAGTWSYMSPEQIRRDMKLDVRTDVYAFGIVAFEMLAGHLPFTAETALKVAHMHLQDPPPRLAPKIYGVPEWFGNLVGVCLQKKPGDRFQTITEVRRLLEKRMRKMGLLEGPAERTNPVVAFLLRLIGEQ